MSLTRIEPAPSAHNVHIGPYHYTKRQIENPKLIAKNSWHPRLPRTTVTTSACHLCEALHRTPRISHSMYDPNSS